MDFTTGSFKLLIIFGVCSAGVLISLKRGARCQKRYKVMVLRRKCIPFWLTTIRQILVKIPIINPRGEIKCAYILD